jgi:hypothetical protein
VAKREDRIPIFVLESPPGLKFVLRPHEPEGDPEAVSEHLTRALGVRDRRPRIHALTVLNGSDAEVKTSFGGEGLRVRWTRIAGASERAPDAIEGKTLREFIAGSGAAETGAGADLVLRAFSPETPLLLGPRDMTTVLFVSDLPFSIAADMSFEAAVRIAGVWQPLERRLVPVSTLLGFLAEPSISLARLGLPGPDNPRKDH